MKNSAEAATNKVEQLGDAAMDKMQKAVKVTKDQVEEATLGGGHCGKCGPMGCWISTSKILRSDI